MSSTSFNAMPIPLAGSIFFVVVGHMLFEVVAGVTVFAVLNQNVPLFLIGLVACIPAFRDSLARTARDQFRRSWHYRRAMRLTKHLKGFFAEMLEKETFYAASDLFQGHKLVIRRSDEMTLVHDLTGAYVFDELCVATWAPSLLELYDYVEDPRPASSEQLEAIIKKLRTYR